MLLLAALSVCACGCGDSGPQLVPVQGTVTLDGEPLVGASVVFVPDKGRSSTATTDAAGRYELWYSREKRGAITGEHMVEIRTKTVETDENETERRIPQKVPAKYNDSTELIVTVEEGQSDYPLVLTSDEP
jgi:hypothetical protein